MNIHSLLSFVGGHPGWLALTVFCAGCFFILGKSLGSERAEQARRHAESSWKLVSATVDRRVWPPRGEKEASPSLFLRRLEPHDDQVFVAFVSCDTYHRAELGARVCCRIGRHPDDPPGHPLRCDLVSS